ncbi:unnamed protein product [Leuciscus chuanchicus]
MTIEKRRQAAFCLHSLLSALVLPVDEDVAPLFSSSNLRDLCPERQHSVYHVPRRNSKPELCMVECQLGSGCILPLMRLEMLTHSYSYSG